MHSPFILVKIWLFFLWFIAAVWRYIKLFYNKVCLIEHEVKGPGNTKIGISLCRVSTRVRNTTGADYVRTVVSYRISTEVFVSYRIPNVITQISVIFRRNKQSGVVLGSIAVALSINNSGSGTGTGRNAVPIVNNCVDICVTEVSRGFERRFA